MSTLAFSRSRAPIGSAPFVDPARCDAGNTYPFVERTVTRFEETGEYVQTQVLTPVREVAAIVTGVKVALETLFGYPDRKPIDQAYQDEELFI